MSCHPDQLQSIGHIFDRWRKQAPDALCQKKGEEVWSRRQVSQAAGFYASFLQTLGLEQGDVVTFVCVDQPRALQAMLGLWSLGCAALFLDPRDKIENLKQLAHNAGARRVVTDHPGHARRGDFALLPESHVGEMKERKPADFSQVDADLDAVIYSTSGTTKLPRFRRKSHASLQTDQIAAIEKLRLSANLNSLSVGSLAFNAVLSDCIRCFIYGAENHFLPFMFRTSELDEALRNPAIEKVALAPVLIRDLLRYHRKNGTINQSTQVLVEPIYPHLDRLISLGGPISAKDLTDAYHYLAPKVRKVYSASGIGPISLVEGEEIKTYAASVGRPLVGVEIEIARPQKAPPGQEFRSPTGAKIGAIIAKREVDGQMTSLETGDLGWMSEDGYLHIVGRDHQIACRNSINLNLGDIENKVRSLQDIRDCCVFARPFDDGSNDQIFMAIESDDDLTTLTKNLKELLPTHHQPDWLLTAKLLPRNGSNKVHLHALQSLAENSQKKGGYIEFG